MKGFAWSPLNPPLMVAKYSTVSIRDYTVEVSIDNLTAEFLPISLWSLTVSGHIWHKDVFGEVCKAHGRLSNSRRNRLTCDRSSVVVHRTPDRVGARIGILVWCCFLGNSVSMSLSSGVYFNKKAVNGLSVPLLGILIMWLWEFKLSSSQRLC